MPACQKFVKEDGVTFDNAKFGEVIPLKDDKSNSIIATCQGSTVSWTPPTPPATPEKSIDAADSKPIYDPVQKSSTAIADS